MKQQKPHPGGLILAIHRAKAISSLSVYLGDSVRDIEASKRAGILSAAALWGFGDKEKLKSASPDFAFTDPKDALRLIACNPAFHH